METYRYKATTEEGVETAGVVEATDFDDAIQRLMDQRLREIQVFRVPALPPSVLEAEIVPVALNAEEALLLGEQIAQVSLAEVPLAAGLRVAAEESSSRRVGTALYWIADQVEQGRPLEEALTGSGRLLPPYLSGLILAAARTGRLGEALFQLVEQQQKTRALRREVYGAYVYPLCVVALSAAITLGLGYFVSGWMYTVMEEFELELPLVSRVFFWWRNVGFWLACSGLLVVALLAACYRMVGGAARWRRLISTIPLFGALWHWLGVAEWAGLMSLLVHHRVPLPEALRWAGRGARDANVGQLSRRMADGVARGRTLAQMMYATPFMPVTLIPLVQWGEKSGSLAESFRAGQEMLAKRARMRALLLQSVIPPLLFILVGSMVLFIVIAQFGPMINLITALS